MDKIWDILYDALRKQAFSVILLIIACGVMGKVIVDMKQEAKDQDRQLRAIIEHCVMEREGLRVQVATLTGRVDMLSAAANSKR